MHAEWKAKVLAYFTRTVHRNADQWIARAGEQGQPIVEDDLDVVLGEQAEPDKLFRLSLHAQLLSSTMDLLSKLVRNGLRGNGRETMRVVPSQVSHRRSVKLMVSSRTSGYVATFVASSNRPPPISLVHKSMMIVAPRYSPSGPDRWASTTTKPIIPTTGGADTYWRDNLRSWWPEEKDWAEESKPDISQMHT